MNNQMVSIFLSLMFDEKIYNNNNDNPLAFVYFFPFLSFPFVLVSLSI